MTIMDEVLAEQLRERARRNGTHASPPPDEPEIPVPEPEPWPAAPAAEAYHGLAGEIVRTIEPQTEADPVGMLVQLLVMYGNVIGRSAHWRVENAAHYGNLYCCLVGDTATGRKGTSFGRALQAFGLLEGDDWMQRRIVSGMSSGEGLIWALRDRVLDKDGDTVDPGEPDKRLLVVEPEFAQPLRMMRRDGNTLGMVIRQGWDGGVLGTLTKNTRTRATGAHLSMLAHITRQELGQELAAVESANGFANRFLWVAVRRARLLPFGGQPVDLGRLSIELAETVRFARQTGEVDLTAAARELFDAGGMYADLSGPVGAVLNRGAAQVRRLAMLYALLDCRAVVDTADLRAAKALWDYCGRSVRWIFGESTGDKMADELLLVIRDAGQEGMSQSQICGYFGRHERAARIGTALQALLEAGHVRLETISTTGRPVKRWYMCCAKSAKSEKSGGART